MVWLKGCPKCKGDLFLDQDSYGTFQSCIQCGYMKDLMDETGAAITVQHSLPADDNAWMDLMVGLPEAA